MEAATVRERSVSLYARKMAAAQPTPFPWHRHVPRLGTGQEFAALRSLLENCEYSNEGLCRRLGVDDLDKYVPQPAAELIARPIDDTLAALMRLFYHSVFAEETDIAAAMPEGSLALLDALGLISREPAPPGMIYGASAILPAAGFLTVCDRGNHAPDGNRCDLPADVVYPAIFDTTRKFLEGLPDSPCDAMLDLGTGTGIAAMLGARSAQHVWATDITERSALYAEFNRRLYGLENLTVLTGDLFAPVEGLTFDRIVIHPPYVPAKPSQTQLVFRDAGEDGEQIIRRTIQELPRYLRPGGRFYCLLMATDRENETFEDRMRKWLGDVQPEFDIVVAARSLQSPREFLAQLITAGRVDSPNIPVLLEVWKATKTQALVYAAVLMERHTEEARAITRRVQTGAGYTGRHLEWLLEWEKSLRRPEQLQALLEGNPMLAPDCELHVVSRMREGVLCAEEFTFQCHGPFRSRARCDGGIAQVLMQCDGSAPARAIFSAAKSAGLIPEGATAEEFAALLGSFASEGILRVPD
jgi:SAM-dependent methyltransferase